MLILKATLGQKPKNQPSSSLIILKKSPVIIMTGNRKTKLALRPEALAMLTDGVDLRGGRMRPWYQREA